MNKKWIYILRMFVLAMIAGLAIGIGGIVFLSVEIKLAGALMFTVGLYAICVHELNLFTGKVGYLPERTPLYLFDLLVIWLGNLTGTWITAALALHSRIKGISELAQSMCEVKKSDGILSLFFLGILCGFLMYVAVDGYAKTKNPIILLMWVAAFILGGFEHCIADMFYFSAAEMWSFDTLLRVLVITLGNSVGGMFIPLGKKLKAAE
ncbi:MAG: formate/nitrite transporter family protein [Lachnospiraceae bacterium]|nr:formate/nitrite transporter family protein [Lachnospiraceae bacterium]